MKEYWKIYSFMLAKFSAKYISDEYKSLFFKFLNIYLIPIFLLLVFWRIINSFDISMINKFSPVSLFLQQLKCEWRNRFPY